MDSGSTNDLVTGGGFGRYRIVRRLAIGGSAEIFLAEDANANAERVVLKIPFENGSDVASRNAAIEHEAAIGARLDHPSIVRTLGTATDGSRVALVVEYVDGIPLDALLDAHRLDVPTALRIVVDLAAAIDAAHAATSTDGMPLGVVHRDLNPHNVLVARDGRVKLLDFGIARSRLATSRTRTGSLKGTLRYLAPEQATGSELDRRTDVYALGLLGYEMIAHEPYLAGSSDVELLRAAELAEPRPMPDDLADEVASALAKSLARFPEERFARASGLAAKLEPFAGDAATVRATLAGWVEAARPPEPGTTDPAKAVATPTRTRRAALGIAALGIAALVGIALATTIGPSPADAPPRRASTSTRSSVVAPPTVVADAIASDPGTPPPVAIPTQATSRPPRVGPTPSIADSNRETSVAPNTASANDTATPQQHAEPAAPSATELVAAPSRASIRAKLARADASLRDARARGVDVSGVEALSREALEAYVEGRYLDADRLLDRILGRLDPS